MLNKRAGGCDVLCGSNCELVWCSRVRYNGVEGEGGVVVVLVFWGSSWECFQFSARLGACFARKTERMAWQGAEVNVGYLIRMQSRSESAQRDERCLEWDC